MTEQVVKFDEKFARIMCYGGFFAVNMDYVNLGDILDWEPGRIVRVGNCERIDDVLRFFPCENEAIGCIAGWISDEDQA